jgi:hypothetical protein
VPDQFDPYAQWLGIVEPQRPVNYYVLLGIAPSESDPARIAQAADMQAARVRRIRPGPYLVQWSALLDEIAAAKACLTNPQARAAYDAALVGQRSAPQMVAAPSATGGAVAGPHGQSGQTAQPLTAATTSAQPQLQQAAGQAHQPAVQYQPVLSWPSAPATQQSAIATQPSPIATQPYGVPTPPPDRAFAEPATLTAGTVSPGSGLSGQFGADAPLSATGQRAGRPSSRTFSRRIHAGAGLRHNATAYTSALYSTCSCASGSDVCRCGCRSVGFGPYGGNRPGHGYGWAAKSTGWIGC